MTDSLVSLTRQGAVAIVTMAGPGGRNALTAALKSELRDTLAAVEADESVRAVVLAGGEKAFCVGQDLAEHASTLAVSPAAAFATVHDHYEPIVRSLTGMPKPTIAAVDGACVGAGLGFALACDLRVFGREAMMGTAFTGIGLTFDSGLSYTLPRAVGDAKARELILLGATFSAEEAVSWGIAGQIVEPGSAVDTAVALASKLAAGPTTAFAVSKKLLAGPEGALEAALANEAWGQEKLGGTSDHPAAVKAFLAREKPEFTGK